MNGVLANLLSGTLGAIIGAIVGGLATYFATRWQTDEDRKRHRAAIATAMVAELEALDVVLRQVEQFGSPLPLLEVAPRMDVIERTADYVAVLSPEAVRALLTLNILLKTERRNLQEIDRDLAERGRRGWTHAQEMNARDEHDQLVRAKAASLLEGTSDVRRLLVSDGALELSVPRSMLTSPRHLATPTGSAAPLQS